MCWCLRGTCKRDGRAWPLHAGHELTEIWGSRCSVGKEQDAAWRAWTQRFPAAERIFLLFSNGLAPRALWLTDIGVYFGLTMMASPHLQTIPESIRQKIPESWHTAHALPHALWNMNKNNEKIRMWIGISSAYIIGMVKCRVYLYIYHGRVVKEVLFVVNNSKAVQSRVGLKHLNPPDLAGPPDRDEELADVNSRSGLRNQSLLNYNWEWHRCALCTVQAATHCMAGRIWVFTIGIQGAK